MASNCRDGDVASSKVRFTAACGDISSQCIAYRYTVYPRRRNVPMIKSFGNRETEQIAQRRRVKSWGNIEAQIQRKLAYLNAAAELDDLKAPPGNRLEARKGDRKGQFSIRINDQYRLCFKWECGNAYDVEVTDYH